MRARAIASGRASPPLPPAWGVTVSIGFVPISHQGLTLRCHFPSRQGTVLRQGTWPEPSMRL